MCLPYWYCLLSTNRKKVWYLLFGTNSTGEFFLRIIRWAQHSIAVGFNMVKQSTISTWSTTWYWVWVLVNTLIHGAMTITIVWHEIARVLQSPCWWTLSFSWDHCDCHPCWSIAHSTGDIVLINSREWSSSCLIPCSIHIVVPLNSRCVAEIVWIIWHAEVVGCSSLMCVVCSTNPSCIHQSGAWDIWTTAFPPPCVDHSTISWSRGTCYSLLSLLSLWSTRTRHPISSRVPCILEDVMALNATFTLYISISFSLDCSQHSTAQAEYSNMRWLKSCKTVMSCKYLFYNAWYTPVCMYSSLYGYGIDLPSWHEVVLGRRWAIRHD